MRAQFAVLSPRRSDTPRAIRPSALRSPVLIDRALAEGPSARRSGTPPSAAAPRSTRDRITIRNDELDAGRPPTEGPLPPLRRRGGTGGGPAAVSGGRADYGPTGGGGGTSGQVGEAPAPGGGVAGGRGAGVAARGRGFDLTSESMPPGRRSKPSRMRNERKRMRRRWRP